MTLDLLFRRTPAALALAAVIALAVPAPPAAAQVPALRQAVAEAAARDDDLAAFYRARQFEPVWAGSDEAAVERRNALLSAMAGAERHGLPAARFDPHALMARLRAARTVEEQGRMDVEMSEAFLDYAHAVQTGILDPDSVVSQIHRDVPVQDGRAMLEAFLDGDPVAYLHSLPPQTPEYVRLMHAREELLAAIAEDRWGPAVPGIRMDRGATGDAVIALRNRLVGMGYLAPTTTAVYDDAIAEAVRAFQETHGMEQDGVAGAGTIAAINVPPEARLESVLVAMERERWLGGERGDRHVWVNLTDMSAAIVDNDRVTFRTRSVIGSQPPSRQTPEFSDVMEHMVINPSWWVPRSIIVNEYGGRVPGGFQAVDYRGRVVPVSNVLSGGSVNYSVRQPPGPGNALGRVKFMFPNRYNIYLHDTPARHLFSRNVRTFSHGCIRLNDPLEFAYHLLARQTDDPVEFFQARLRSGQETPVQLEEHVPVHIDYRTAFTDVTGRVHYRDDVYGRDARIWSALAREGVAISDLRG